MQRKNKTGYFSRVAFNFRMMGINFFVPIIVMLLLILYLYLICYLAGMTEAFYFRCSECAVPLFGSWWAIHLMRPILEDKGNEIYYSCGASRLYLGLMRIMEGWVVYCLLTTIYCVVLRMMTTYHFWSFLLQLIIQSMFYFGLGFLSISITGKSWYSWIINLVYGLFYLYTRNRFLPAFSIYTMWETPLLLDAFFCDYIIRVFLFSLITLVCAQILFSIRGFDGKISL